MDDNPLLSSPVETHDIPDVIQDNTVDISKLDAQKLKIKQRNANQRLVKHQKRAIESVIIDKLKESPIRHSMISSDWLQRKSLKKVERFFFIEKS